MRNKGVYRYKMGRSQLVRVRGLVRRRGVVALLWAEMEAAYSGVQGLQRMAHVPCAALSSLW